MTLKSDAKFEEKPTSGLKKMTRGIWQIFTRTLESLKIGTLMGSFCPSRKCMSLKFMCHDNED